MVGNKIGGRTTKASDKKCLKLLELMLRLERFSDYLMHRFKTLMVEGSFRVNYKGRKFVVIVNIQPVFPTITITTGEPYRYLEIILQLDSDDGTITSEADAYEGTYLPGVVEGVTQSHLSKPTELILRKSRKFKKLYAELLRYEKGYKFSYEKGEKVP